MNCMGVRARVLHTSHKHDVDDDTGAMQAMTFYFPAAATAVARKVVRSATHSIPVGLR